MHTHVRCCHDVGLCVSVWLEVFFPPRACFCFFSPLFVLTCQRDVCFCSNPLKCGVTGDTRHDDREQSACHQAGGTQRPACTPLPASARTPRQEWLYCQHSLNNKLSPLVCSPTTQISQMYADTESGKHTRTPPCILYFTQPLACADNDMRTAKKRCAELHQLRYLICKVSDQDGHPSKVCTRIHHSLQCPS